MSLFGLFSGDKSSSTTNQPVTTVEGGGSALTGANSVQAQGGIGLATQAKYLEQGASDFSNSSARIGSADISGSGNVYNDPALLSGITSDFANAVQNVTASGATANAQLSSAIQTLAAAQLAQGDWLTKLKTWAMNNAPLLILFALSVAGWIFLRKKK
jgi:hypothetical protein